MQPLARDSLTADQVTALLLSPALEVSAGAELLAADLTLVEDISDDLLGGSVERNLYATIHGTAKLDLTRALAWGVDLVRPYMTLSDGVTTARFNAGVFCLTTPERTVGETPETYSCQGFDRVMLLGRQVGEDYAVTATTTYYDALTQAFTDAGLTGVLIDGSADDLTLPADKSWPLVARSTDPDQTTSPVTWLRVINDLLLQINFRAVWADENGIFRCSAYQQPAVRPPEFTFDADDPYLSIVDKRVLAHDVWGVPNRWVFRQSNRPSGSPTATEGDGIYTVDLSDPVNGDWLGRTLVNNDTIDYEAADQTALESLGDRRVATDRSVTTTLKVTTGPFPPAGHADVYTYRDADLASSLDLAGAEMKVQAVSWTLDLTGADSSFVWEVVDAS